jgi:hypothetical protein
MATASRSALRFAFAAARLAVAVWLLVRLAAAL